MGIHLVPPHTEPHTAALMLLHVVQFVVGFHSVQHHVIVLLIDLLLLVLLLVSLLRLLQYLQLPQAHEWCL